MASERTDDLTTQLIIARIDDVKASVNQRIDGVEKTFNQRMDMQDRDLGEIKAQTTKTNGRVTALEIARTRAQGAISAYRWVPIVLTSGLSAGITILLFAVTGGHI